MKLVEVIQYENDKAICLVYANTQADLGTVLIRNGKQLVLSAGSFGYTPNGKFYVYDGEGNWAPLGGN